MSWSEAPPRGESGTHNANPTGINQYTRATATARELSASAEGAEGKNAVLLHRTAEVAHKVAMDHARRLGLHTEAALHEAKAREHSDASEKMAEKHPVF
jgi:hypothetical protein